MRPVHKILILLVVVVATGCSKDKRIENSITKKNGKWDVSSVTYTRIEQVVSGTNVGQIVTVDKTENNVGTMTFQKDNGEVVFDFTLNGEYRNDIYGFTVNDENIILRIKMGLNGIFNIINNFTIEQQSVSYIGEQTGKNSMTIDGSEVYQRITDTSTVQISMTATYELSR